MQQKTLLDVPTGKIVEIKDHPLKCRMVELGMHIGKYIQLKGRAPFGKAYAVQVENQVYAFRQEELLRIVVQ